MKALLAIVLVLTAVQAQANHKLSVHCIAKDGLELKIPDSSHMFMQMITLENDYDEDFLANLIFRHPGQKTTDKNLYMNVQLNVCQREGDAKTVCDAQLAFGGATYSYPLDGDLVTVSTSVHGSLKLELVQDANGIYQMDLLVKNNKGSGKELHITKEIGPKIDPAKNSLTPWSPGCLFVTAN